MIRSTAELAEVAQAIEDVMSYYLEGDSMSPYERQALIIITATDALASYRSRHPEQANRVAIIDRVAHPEEEAR